MGLSFIYPAALWLLLLIPLLLGLALLAPRRLPRGRFWASLILRALLLTAIVFAIAGAQFVRRVDRLTTVFLVDSSDSVSPDERVRAEQFVEAALATMREDDQAAIVAFGENALVERAPSSERGLRRIQSAPVTTRTNLQEALNLGLALLPAETQKRLVLLSDGGENSGEVRSAVSLAQTRGVPIEVVALGESGNDLVQLSDLRAPATVRKGQTIPLQVVIEAGVATPATIRLRSGEQLIDERSVNLEPGRQTFEFSVAAEADGFARYSAEVEVAGDNRRQNNEAAALVDVQGEPRVLVVEGKPGEGRNLADALRAAKFSPTVVAPEGIPTGLAELGSYDAVVLANVAAGKLPTSAMNTLPAYVRDLGRGLLMIGGDRAYGMGGYNKTPVEEALPVHMEVRDKERRPDVALVFVVDKSGSMAACHCNDPNQGPMNSGGVVKVDIAKEAILQASALLQAEDKLGVVAFDDVPRWAVDIAQLPSLVEIEQAIAPVQPNGRTNVRGGLLAAQAALEKTDARVKHVILLTDGWSQSGNATDIADDMRAQGITISTVAAGSGSAPYLEELAEHGGGRYYAVANMEDVPQIFVDETVKTVGSYLIEEQFVPTLVGDSPILSGLTDAGWPSLYGYNGTELKDSAQLILRSPQGDPVLAQWQYGLGRAVAWTSDLKGQWGKDLVDWQDFATFAAQLVGWTVPRDVENALNAQARVEGTQAIITAEAKDVDGNPLPDARVDATIFGPDGAEQAVELRQVGPGQFQGELPSPQAGQYLVQLSGSSGDTAAGSQMVGLVVPYSPEYRQQQSNPALLEAIAADTGGRVLQSPSGAFEHNLASVRRAQEISLPLLLLAVLLLPLDIAIRRLSLRRGDFADARGWTAARLARRPAAEAVSPVLGDLQRAKARATVRAARGTASPGEPLVSPPEQPATAPPSSRPPATPVERAAPAAQPEQLGDGDALSRLRAAKERARRK